MDVKRASVNADCPDSLSWGRFLRRSSELRETILIDRQRETGRQKMERSFFPPLFVTWWQLSPCSSTLSLSAVVENYCSDCIRQILMIAKRAQTLQFFWYFCKCRATSSSKQLRRNIQRVRNGGEQEEWGGTNGGVLWKSPSTNKTAREDEEEEREVERGSTNEEDNHKRSRARDRHSFVRGWPG